MDYRLIVSLCTKRIVCDGICNDLLKKVVEAKQLMFRKVSRLHSSAKQQLFKIHIILADQRRRKAGLSVMLFVEIKNTFNAFNHWAVFEVSESETDGFPAKDIDLLRRMYSRLFFIVGNSLGETAVLYLLRGDFKGAPFSLTMFILTFYPFLPSTPQDLPALSPPAAPKIPGPAMQNDENSQLCRTIRAQGPGDACCRWPGDKVTR